MHVRLKSLQPSDSNSDFIWISSYTAQAVSAANLDQTLQRHKQTLNNSNDALSRLTSPFCCVTREYKAKRT